MSIIQTSTVTDGSWGQYSKMHTYRPKQSNDTITIITNLASVFPASITVDAIRNCTDYLQENKNKSFNLHMRLKLVVHCIYQAFYDRNEPVPIEYIQERMQSKGYCNERKIKRSSKDFRIGVQIIKSELFIPFYARRIHSTFSVLQKLNLDTIISESIIVLNRCRETVNGNDMCLGAPANQIAIVVLFYHINELHNNQFNSKSFADVCYISSVCLSGYYKRLIANLPKDTSV